ncbi:hypothetical protein V8D89_015778 [Ganoderma adspersum]
MNQHTLSEHSDFRFGNSAEDDELESEFDGLNRPGKVVERSIDHYVTTLPFVSFDYVHNPYQEKLGNLRNLLGHKPLDKTDVIMSFGKTPGSTSPNSDSICCPVEVMAILIHQIELMCCNRPSHTCWEASWRYTAKHLLATPQQNGPGTKQCAVFHTQYNLLSFRIVYSATPTSPSVRSTTNGVGERAVTHPGYSHGGRPNNDLFPYTPLLDSLEKWEKLLLKADKERRRVEPHWDADWDSFQQMDSSIKHIWQVELTISDDRTIFSGNALPQSTQARTICIGSYMRAFKSRVRHYPLEDTVDGTVTVIVKDLCHTLDVRNSSDPDNLGDNFLFFRSLDGATLPHLTPDIMVLNYIKATPQIQLHLPVLLVTHQKEAGELRPATCNEQRMDCVSAVRILAPLGIKDFPVYGLTTYGSRGLLCQTWYSEADQCCYILDQVPDAFRFDISNEEGVRRYRAILTAVKGHAEELRSRFESLRESIVEKLSTSQGRESLQWTLRAQIKQHPPFAREWED